MRFFLIVICFFFLTYSLSASADTPPVPPSKKASLKTLEKKLDEQKQQKEALARKVKEIEGELDQTKDRLVKIGRSIQKNETTLQSLENQIQELEEQQSNIQANLKKDRQSIARLLLALERIRRVPPEALIAKPGAPLKTAQSAMLMRDIIPTLHHQAETLRVNLKNLEKISKDLKTKKEKALKASKSLISEHTKLSSLVNKRQQLYASTHQDLREHEKSVKKISHQAKNLQDLVKKLEENKRREAARKKEQEIANAGIPLPGQARLPITGIIRTGYDQPDAFGAPSKGLTIEGRSGALVVAPMGGTIRFAGPFKNYGNMVILEHKNGYHSLIAGFEKIDTVVGHNVSVGEPLGLLNQTAASKKPTLYYELRLDSRPINPAKKFGNIS